MPSRNTRKRATLPGKCATDAPSTNSRHRLPKSHKNMHSLDILVITAYISGILALGIYCGRRQSRREFFMASRSMGWIPVGLSVMATLFSSNSFVFYPAAAFGNSLRIGLGLIGFLLMTPVVVWVFIPVYSRLNVETAYEYLEHRFHVSVRALASGLFILLRIGWMASATFAASVVVAEVAAIPQLYVILGLGVVAIGYTMLGGLRAVMWTDVLQFFIFSATILATFVLVMWKSHLTLGGVWDNYFTGRDGLVVDFEYSLQLKYGTWAILIGSFLEGLSAFGADQVAVQRYLSARSERTSQWAAWLNLAGMWIVIPGLLFIGVALFAHFSHHPDELPELVLDQPQVTADTSSVPAFVEAHPKAADRVLPGFVRIHFLPGMAGLFLAALGAAIMSSIDSGIHSVTTAFIVDFRDRLYPQWTPQTDQQDVRWIRLSVILIGGISVGLACFVEPLGDVFDIGKKLTAAFGGPLLAIFVLAFFSRRATSLAVFIGALIATGLTLALMYLRYDWFSVWHWPIGFGLSLVLGYLLSWFTPRVPTQYTWYDIVRQPKHTASLVEEGNENEVR